MGAAPVLAGVGRGSSIGALSVPPSWAGGAGVAGGEHARHVGLAELDHPRAVHRRDGTRHRRHARGRQRRSWRLELRCPALRRQAQGHADYSRSRRPPRNPRGQWWPVKPQSQSDHFKDGIRQMAFDFAARPPEINSALMYSGAGAGPMMAAASSFSALSSELASNAASYESVISQLGSEWTGPSSTAMAASAQTYIELADHHLGATAGSGRRGHLIGGGLRGGPCRHDPAAGCHRQPGAAGGVGRDQHPGPEHPGDRGQRGHVRRVLGAGRHRDVQLRRRGVGSLVGADTVDRPDRKHQPGRAGRDKLPRSASAVGSNGTSATLNNSSAACRAQRVRPPARCRPRRPRPAAEHRS